MQTASFKLGLLAANPKKYLSGSTNINVFDINTSSESRSIHHKCLSHQEFEKVIGNVTQSCVSHVRVISFHCPWTVLPLEACKDDLDVVFNTYNVHPLFADAILAFGARPTSEDGGNYPGVRRKAGTNSFECWYRLKYMEKNARSKLEPWSARHTAIYHQYDEERNFNLILLFNPSDESVFETKLFSLQEKPHDRLSIETLARNTSHFHVLLCETYLDGWGDHLQDYASKLQKLKSDIEDIELQPSSNTSDLDMIRALHEHHETAAKAAIFCQGNSNILRIVSELFNAQNEESAQWLLIKADRALDHHAGYNLLTNQAKNAMEHLQYVVNHQNQALAIGNQMTATKLNKNLLDLNVNAADDSAAIKVITILGLIFLPGGFVAALFGMDFFSFSGSGLVVGNNLWIFLAFWIPITLVTISIYIAFVVRRRRQTSKRRNTLGSFETA